MPGTTWIEVESRAVALGGLRFARPAAIVVVIGALLASLLPPSWAVAADDHVRIAGANRVGTAAAVARSGWDRAEAVVVARSDEPADALSGSALAGQLDAPLLVTPPDRLADEISAEVTRLGATDAYVLGGEAALAPAVVEGLRAAGVERVHRLAGADRYGTARIVADSLQAPPDGTALIVGAWPDALGVSGLAAQRAAAGDPWPVLVVGHSVPQGTWDALAALRPARVLLIGGEAAVSAQVERALADTYRVDRIGGDTRYATSLAIASLSVGSGPLVVATGSAFPDGLAAGPYAARTGGTLLLVPPDAADDAHLTWLSSDPGPSGVTVIGGVRAVAEDVASALVDALHTADSRTSSETRLGLHVTVGELARWRQRAVSGPYRVKGDVSVNSPGDWERIVARKDRFLDDPQAGRWNGPTANHPDGCVEALSSDVHDPTMNPPVEEPGDLRDAAFYALVAVDAADAGTAARTAARALVAQVDHADTVFSDRDRYCLDLPRGDMQPVWTVANWLTQLLFAYDYLNIAESDHGPLFTDAERAGLEGWFVAAARWMVPANDRHLDELFVARAEGDYTLTETARADYGDRITYLDGPVARTLHRRYNNRSARTARYVTVVGTQTGDQGLQEHGRRYVREALMFSYFPQGVVGDNERWTDADPTRGWSYAAEFTGALLSIAEHLARTGDTSLYDFRTVDGALGTQGSHRSGSPRSLATLASDIASYVDSTTVRYGTDDPSRARPEYRIDPVNDLGGYARIHDVQLLMAAAHYRDPYVRSVILRTAPGAPDYPSEPRHGLGHPEGGDAGVYPAMLFMFERS